ncbi:hypothetical protein ACFQHO_05690 [Actinomadura yumaensis]
MASSAPSPASRSRRARQRSSIFFSASSVSRVVSRCTEAMGPGAS